MAVVENVKMCQRSDLAANWAAVNPVLLNGELGAERDTGRLKLGDGASDWNTLGYLGGGVQRVNGILPDVQGGVTLGASAIEGVVCSATVEEMLACTQEEYTALESKDGKTLYLVAG